MTHSRIVTLAVQTLLPCLCLAADHTFAVAGDQFMLDGKPILLISGEMHYPRVPRVYWHDRMRKMKAMGLNTLTTYVFWNVHEPDPGKFDFTGNADLAEYIRTAQQEGLWVILRPGPYVCSEWDFGGLPAWLMRDPQMKLRQNDPGFMKPAATYMDAIGKQLAPLQVTHGGPIIMVQVENEYGSFGSDHEYMRAVQGMIRHAGFDVQLYTADGADQKLLQGGSLPDLPIGINFGGGDDPAQQFADLDKFRAGGPRINSEFWVGWFDTWGKKHATGPLERAAAGLDWMLSRGISVSLYMIHGGTNFGFNAGADYHAFYEPDITSYDYDSPLDEAGRPTRKFAAFRDVIARHLPPGVKLPDVPPGPELIEIPQFTFSEMAPPVLGKPVHSKTPLTMPQLAQSHGMVVYHAKATQQSTGTLEASGILDYAIVSVNGRVVGTWDRHLAPTPLQAEIPAGATIEVLLDAMGHVNFTRHILDERKGLTELRLNGTPLENWEIFSIPLDAPPKSFAKRPVEGPAFYRAHFQLTQTGDTYLDLRGWGKGYVWVNGHNLGRYWRIGPQQSLYVPAPWLRTGKNEIVVLDLESGGTHTMRGIKDLVFETLLDRED